MNRQETLGAALMVLVVFLIGITAALTDEITGWVMALCYLLLLRDYFRAVCNEYTCEECHDTGLTTIRGMCGGVEMDCDDQPCWACGGISKPRAGGLLRKALATKGNGVES